MDSDDFGAAVNCAHLTFHPGNLIDASIAIGNSGKQFFFARLAVHEIIVNLTMLTPTG